MRITLSIDVEPDLHSRGHKGVTAGLKELEKIIDKTKIKPLLFVVAKIIPEHKKIFQRLLKKGWEISLHGLSHKRFDEMSYSEKETEIKKSLQIFKKSLNIKPKGFRAPQHSIDDDTLNLLEKYGFKYDSSYHPLNLLQLFFFPNKFKLWARLFFSPLKPYKIRKNLLERPCSSLIIPNVSLTYRILPVWAIRVYLFILSILFKEVIFYAHSWDFIEVKDSRIDRLFSHQKLINKLNCLLQ